MPGLTLPLADQYAGAPMAGATRPGRALGRQVLGRQVLGPEVERRSLAIYDAIGGGA